MSTNTPTRRNFLLGTSAAAAGLAGVRFGNLVFAQPNSAYNDELLVVVFLRGGMDGLSLVPPIDGADRGHYETARPDLAVPVAGNNAALSLDAAFGLNPNAAPLHELYQNGNLAVVLATGLDEANRSHFDSMEFIERGTPGNKHTASGWLARHLASADNLPAEVIMPSISVGSTQTTSLLGDRNTINLADPDQFNLRIGPWQWRDAQRVALRHLYSENDTWLHQAGLQALDAVDIVELNTSGSYEPSNGADYPSGTFGEHLKVVAQMTKLDLGLRIATIDLGGWDTHEGQGDEGQGYFGSRISELSRGLHALYTDLDGNGPANYAQRLTMVVQSEFGRRLRSNADRGTDHGHGNVMLVAGGNVNSGVHGDWPGLASDQLYDNADVAVTTDFRRVLSEILIRRLGNNRLGIVFPGYTDYAPIGFVQGEDLAPDYTTEQDILFEDDFENGDTAAWSTSVG